MVILLLGLVCGLLVGTALMETAGEDNSGKGRAEAVGARLTQGPSSPLLALRLLADRIWTVGALKHYSEGQHRR